MISLSLFLLPTLGFLKGLDDEVPTTGRSFVQSPVSFPNDIEGPIAVVVVVVDVVIVSSSTASSPFAPPSSRASSRVPGSDFSATFR